MSTATNDLFANDAALASVDRKKYNHVADEATIGKVVEALKSNGHNAEVVSDKAAALAKIISLIPAGKSINSAGSTTLGEIGFIDEAKKGAHGWLNLKEAVVAEKDAAKQAELRAKASTADFHLTSVDAIDHHGTLYAVCATGTRSGPLLFGPSHVIVVVGANKIVADRAAAQDRIQNYALQVESARVRVAYASWGVKASATNFAAEVRKASPFSQEKRFTVIIVKETLGF